MYSLVMFRSRGMQRTVPSVSEWITTLLHKSGKSVSMTPIELISNSPIESLLFSHEPTIKHTPFRVAALANHLCTCNASPNIGVGAVTTNKVLGLE